MTGRMNIESAPYTGATGYAGRPVTKPPNWHGYVVLDTLFNNLSAGLFLVAALAELARPAAFAGLATLAYPMALLLLAGDLVCLVLDLGDPLRFHHMLRVWKPSSPMSLGTWCLTAYGAFLTGVTLLGLWPGGSAALDGLRRVILIVGLIPALGTAVYKGVLFSTTAQPGWSDARWLGGYLSSSALALGAGELLLLATLTAQPEAAAVLRLALILLLVLNLVALGLLLVDLRPALSRAHGAGPLAVIGALAVLAGLLIPLGLLAVGEPLELVGAALLVLLGAAVVRYEIVRLPHLLAETETRNDGTAERWA